MRANQTWERGRPRLRFCPARHGAASPQSPVKLPPGWFTDTRAAAHI